MTPPEVCPGSGGSAVQGLCPMCGGPAEILVRTGDAGDAATLGWHRPWRGYDAAAAQRAALREAARQAVSRATRLVARATDAIAVATRLVAQAEPLVSGTAASGREATRALRAFNELELAGRSAARAAAHLSIARRALGDDDRMAGKEPIAAARPLRDVLEPRHVVTITARTAVIAAMSSESAREAARRCEEASVDGAVMATRQHRHVAAALRSSRSAARLTEEVRARTDKAGRQFALAVGWQAELPVLLSEGRAAAARDPDATHLLTA